MKQKITLVPADIFKINVLKGKKATDMFGSSGRNGVVLIHITCEYEQRTKFPLVFEEYFFLNCFQNKYVIDSFVEITFLDVIRSFHIFKGHPTK